MTFLDQLKQRKLVQWLLAYAAGAWLLLQVVSLVSASFNGSPTVMRAATIAAAVGFFVALLLAWYHGERGAQRVSGTELLLLILVLAIGGGLLWRFAPSAPEVTGPAPSPTLTQQASLASNPISPANAIAVLPFVNMSTDIENGFFADGISEELLNVLARVQGLKVASRTSAFSFKGKDTPIPEIARQLGVRHVLEGSVRKQGSRVRIATQLIDAGNDERVWAETYDRDLTDIFKVQEEIAQAITLELSSILGERQIAVAASTKNLDAYQQFLRGRARFNQRVDLLEAIRDLSGAVEKDPDFGEAWVYLAATWLTAPGYHAEAEIKVSEARAQSRAARKRAEAILPKHPVLMAVKANALEDEGDLVGALALLQESATLSTQDSNPRLWQGILLLRSGYVDEAVATFKMAHEMDPLSGVNTGYLAIALLSKGHDAQAELLARKAVSQGWTPVAAVMSYDLAARGQHERAVALWDDLVAGDTSGFEAERGIRIRSVLADPTSDVSDLMRSSDIRALNFELAIANGRFDLMLNLADKVRAQKPEDRRRQFWLRSAWLPSTLKLREQPRFFLLAEELGFVRLWEARGYPSGCSRLKAAGGDHLSCLGERS